MECKMMKPWSTDSSEWQPSQIKTEPSEHSETPELKPFDPSLITGMSMLPFGFDPLTPPGYIGMYPPVQQQQQNQQLHQPQGPPVVQQRSETPRTSRIAPANASLSCSSSPGMDVTPPKSPKDTPETSEHGSEAETYETEIREPRMNSHGKYKRYKCKNCNFIAITKASFWDHQRTNHLKPEKMLHCPQCPFVTEFKHHLEYHNLNHSNSKPFQCPECPYRCVNNSMLSSHMKSHSDVLAYRCADCSYATKYCHSLKQHLRKYSHNPGPVLNEDGTPNPLPVIDVYGTRRGPRSKGGKVKRVNNAKNKTQCPSSPPPPPPPPPPAIPADLPNDRISPGLPIPPMALAEMYLGFLARQNFIQNTAAVEEALNLVQKEQPKGRSRRKGPAFKFDATLDGDNDEKPAKTTSPVSDTPTQLPPHLNSPRGPLECHFCEIIFKNPDLHTIHMCYHNVHDAFRCNKCGTKCQDSISFFLHLARDPHM